MAMSLWVVTPFYVPTVSHAPASPRLGGHADPAYPCMLTRVCVHPRMHSAPRAAAPAMADEAIISPILRRAGR